MDNNDNLDIYDQTTDTETDTESEAGFVATTDAESDSETEGDIVAPIPNLILFVDENEVNYYLMYLFEFFIANANQDVILIPENELPPGDLQGELQNLDFDNLNQYYFITTISEREE